jgi:hypothetical protein
MKKMLCVAALAVCTMGWQGFALAADMKADTGGTCEAKAIDKNGKALAGAAKTSFLKKCEAEAKPACEEKAIDKNGKALAGAAKASFLKKCEADAKTMH